MKNLIPLFLILIIASCTSTNSDKKVVTKETPNAQNTRAKFEPEDGKCIVFVGQELKAIGGLEKYNDGYIDHFGSPGGFTMYTKIRPGDEEFGFTYKGLAGVHTTDNWGDNDSNMSLQIADTDFKNMALAIGLEIVNHEGEIARGEQDSLVMALGTWIKSLGERPVFLRIGYEFAGEWNHYNREEYIAAFKHFKNTYDKMGIQNIAYVWQSHGWGLTMEQLETWYPGDDYVDWVGYSFFSRWDEVVMLDFARKVKKPVFIAEATPTISTATVKTNGKTKATDLSNPADAEEAWDKWFVPFFKTIHDNEDIVKAISYINCHWKSHEMWKNNPTFQGVDARLQESPKIAAKWKKEMADERYLQASPKLFKYLWRK